jgi:serine/threonine-protein kinase
MQIQVQLDGIKKLEIIEYLGSGGFADVFKVKDPNTSDLYVLKHIFVKSNLKGKEREVFIKRIENEAAVDIPSPFIVKTHGLYKIKPDNYVILFQYIPGGADLKDWLQEHLELPWNEKKKLFMDILKGVSDAHSRNVIHRDLKPENILIAPDGAPKIFDFGIAKFKDRDVSQTGEMKGTYPYMDPHAILKGIKYVDARCDIYALGIILYQMTHPKAWNPWQANNLEFTDFIRHITGGKQHILEIDSSHPFTGDHSALLKDIIINCTYFDMGKRFENVTDIIGRLDGSGKKRPFPLPPTATLDTPTEIPGPTTKPPRKPRKKTPSGTPYLVIEDGSAMDAMYPLVLKNGKGKLLGRQNLDITNQTISKRHSVILREGNRYFIYDAGSKNGTFFNGTKLEPGEAHKVEIRDSDRIRFADLWTRFEFI